VNTTNLTTSTIRDEAQYGVIATSIATSIIEQAKSFSFDEATDSNSVNDVDELTGSGNLGPEAGETLATFNDFDDFDKYSYRDSTMPSAVFDVSCEVMYIHPANLKVKYHSETWHKKIIVTVASPFMTDSIKQASIYSYWFFR
jgi:hypothetical protein